MPVPFFPALEILMEWSMIIGGNLVQEPTKERCPIGQQTEHGLTKELPGVTNFLLQPTQLHYRPLRMGI